MHRLALIKCMDQMVGIANNSLKRKKMANNCVGLKYTFLGSFLSLGFSRPRGSFEILNFTVTPDKSDAFGPGSTVRYPGRRRKHRMAFSWWKPGSNMRLPRHKGETSRFYSGLIRNDFSSGGMSFKKSIVYNPESILANKLSQRKVTWKERKWSCSVVSDSATLWAVVYQAPLSMGFSRQQYWRGLPFPSPGDLPDSGIGPGSPTLQADTLLSGLPGKSKVT